MYGSQLSFKITPLDGIHEFVPHFARKAQLRPVWILGIAEQGVLIHWRYLEAAVRLAVAAPPPWWLARQCASFLLLFPHRLTRATRELLALLQCWWLLVRTDPV